MKVNSELTVGGKTVTRSLPVKQIPGLTELANAGATVENLFTLQKAIGDQTGEDSRVDQITVSFRQLFQTATKEQWQIYDDIVNYYERNNWDTNGLTTDFLNLVQKARQPFWDTCKEAILHQIDLGWRLDPLISDLGQLAELLPEKQRETFQKSLNHYKEKKWKVSDLTKSFLELAQVNPSEGAFNLYESIQKLYIEKGWELDKSISAFALLIKSTPAIRWEETKNITSYQINIGKELTESIVHLAFINQKSTEAEQKQFTEEVTYLKQEKKPLESFIAGFAKLVELGPSSDEWQLYNDLLAFHKEKKFETGELTEAYAKLLTSAPSSEQWQLLNDLLVYEKEKKSVLNSAIANFAQLVQAKPSPEEWKLFKDIFTYYKEKGWGFGNEEINHFAGLVQAKPTPEQWQLFKDILVYYKEKGWNFLYGEINHFAQLVQAKPTSEQWQLFKDLFAYYKEKGYSFGVGEINHFAGLAQAKPSQEQWQFFKDVVDYFKWNKNTVHDFTANFVNLINAKPSQEQWKFFKDAVDYYKRKKCDLNLLIVSFNNLINAKPSQEQWQLFKDVVAYYKTIDIDNQGREIHSFTNELSELIKANPSSDQWQIFKDTFAFCKEKRTWIEPFPSNLSRFIKVNPSPEQWQVLKDVIAYYKRKCKVEWWLPHMVPGVFSNLLQTGNFKFLIDFKNALISNSFTAETAEKCLEELESKPALYTITKYATVLDNLAGFKGIAGMEQLKETLFAEVIDPLRNPQKYEKFKVGIPNGIMLFGPPGCGKTFIAKKLGEESGYSYFMEVKYSDIASSYYHQTAQLIKDMFDRAKRNSPCILFIDEFEGMVPSRQNLHPHAEHRVEEVNEFLTQLNDIAKHKVLVVVATNFPEKIDDAVKRAGRIDKHFYIPPPDLAARIQLFKMYLSGRPSEDMDFEKLASLTDGYACVDIKTAIEEAARLAARNSSEKISQTLLVECIKKRPSSINPELLEHYENISRLAKG